MQKRNKQGEFSMAVPYVSVVLPVYNGRGYLESAIRSILRSTFTDYEVVTIDDGSTDGSHSILEDCAKRYPGRILVHRFEQNRGMDIAMNYAISKVASGSYIARLNQDDEMLEDRLAQQVAFLDANPEVVVIGGQMALMNERGEEFGRISYPLDDATLRRRWMKVSPFGDPCVMYRRETWDRVGGYKQSYWPVDDLALWFLMGQEGKLANIPNLVTRMRWHKGGGSFSRYRLMVRKQFAVRWWAWRSLRLEVSMGDIFFWIAVLACGMIFPPRLNWEAYRLIKRFLP
jgi:glycosyltransferase involved in cell wall biosynthesis